MASGVALAASTRSIAISAAPAGAPWLNPL
jgi:hypothetical protein